MTAKQLLKYPKYLLKRKKVLYSCQEFLMPYIHKFHYFLTKRDLINFINKCQHQLGYFCKYHRDKRDELTFIGTYIPTYEIKGLHNGK